MKTPSRHLLAVCVSLLLATSACPLPAATPADPAGKRETVYVTIDYLDPIRFERLRYARMTGDELILATLKETAKEQAQFAEYAGEVIVLDENAKAPDGATILRLTWDLGTVGADVIKGGKDKYLGVVNRQPLSVHPDFKRMQQSIDQAGLTDARIDASLRADVKMDLYIALQLLMRHQKGVAASN